MIRNSVFRCSAVLFFFGAAANGWSATTYDPAASFEQGYLSHSNPNGVWSYGYSTSFTSPVSLYTQTLQPGVHGPNAQYWSSSPNITAQSSVQYNDGPAYSDGNMTFWPTNWCSLRSVGNTRTWYSPPRRLVHIR